MALNRRDRRRAAKLQTASNIPASLVVPMSDRNRPPSGFQIEQPGVGVFDLTTVEQQPGDHALKNALSKQGINIDALDDFVTKAIGRGLPEEFVLSGLMPLFARREENQKTIVLMVARLPAAPFFAVVPVIVTNALHLNDDYLPLFNTDGLAITGRVQVQNGARLVVGHVSRHEDAVKTAVERDIKIVMMPDWDLPTMNMVGRPQGVQFT